MGDLERGIKRERLRQIRSGAIEDIVRQVRCFERRKKQVSDKKEQVLKH